MSGEAEAFDAAFLRRAPRLGVRPETPDDVGFLTALYRSCSPLAEMLPPPMLAMQADIQRTSHRTAHPHAMWRIATSDGAPIARIAIDWVGAQCYGIDLAALPAFRSTGAGLHFMRAWIEVADRIGKPASLDVIRTNPAARLYARLGFVPMEEELDGPSMAMIRPARP